MPQTESTDWKRPSERKGTSELALTSPAFADGATVPKRYTADGDNVSPPLTWNDGPDGTECFALLCEDPDAPSGVFVHWLLWNLKASDHELPEGVPKTAETFGMRQGENSFGKIGFGGPSPPKGKPHRYVFRLYALDTRLDLAAGATRREFDEAIEGHILAEALLIGMYGR
jgi:Raf kinase inhibitor-like YbhB/YbcL family protein